MYPAEPYGPPKDGSVKKHSSPKRKRVVAFGKNEQDDAPASQAHIGTHAERPTVKRLALDTRVLRLEEIIGSRDILSRVLRLEEMHGVSGGGSGAKAGCATSEEDT